MLMQKLLYLYSVQHVNVCSIKPPTGISEYLKYGWIHTAKTSGQK